MDFLDFLTVKDEEVLTGTYYKRKPITTDDGGLPFSYDIVNESDRTYSTMLNTLQTEQAVQTIVTNDLVGFKVKGYVVTQDGILWQITGIVKRLVKAENKQALRILKQTIDTEYVIRLIAVDNPMGLKWQQKNLKSVA